jgi:hydrogenase expression/formation protein HypE
MDDGAALPLGDQWLVVTTDSHVIHPIFFPGGDIGRLAVAGTVNDLAMMGATEVLALTCGIILEEGFPRAELERIQASMRDTCQDAAAPIVTGDTKVMGNGELDGIVINTTGVALTKRVVSDAGLRPGDRIIVSGTIGDHGFAVLAKRNDLQLEGNLRSDVAPLNELVRAALFVGGEDIVAMKDPTRGGLASAINELAAASNVGVRLNEKAIPIRREVHAACEMLGLDPLYVANEGKLMAIVPPASAGAALAAMRRHPLGEAAAEIGEVVDDHPGLVVLKSVIGGERVVSMLAGEQLPRIC